MQVSRQDKNKMYVYPTKIIPTMFVVDVHWLIENVVEYVLAVCG